MTKHKLNNMGFTLIELLIVIVIIGILAGVVIGVLNPIQQQNRARDATYRSSLNKMALAGKSLFVSSPRTSNRSPSLAEFQGGVGGFQPGSTLCTSNSATLTESCTFTVDGLTLGDDCTAAFWNGVGGGNACEFIYRRTPEAFRIGVRGVASPESTFIYEYSEVGGNVTEGFYTCAATDAITVDLTGASCTPLN